MGGLVVIPKLKETRTYFEAEFDEKLYFERTKRNHYWLGGILGQKKVKDLRIGVAGLGGMGSNIAEILVRLGVGHIRIADPDTIEYSNINRQVIANHNTVGEKKANASADELRNIANDFELVVYSEGITSENAHEFVEGLDAVVDEIDVMPLQAHMWLHGAANQLNLPIYSSYVIGLGVHIYKFQGLEYTLEDFLQKNHDQISSPTPEFLVDRFINPAPSYMASKEDQEGMLEQIRSNNIPIFGASTFAGQSLLSIRLIADLLNLNKIVGGVETPVMPQFLKMDPLDLSMKICSVG